MGGCAPLPPPWGLSEGRPFGVLRILEGSDWRSLGDRGEPWWQGWLGRDEGWVGKRRSPRCPWKIQGSWVVLLGDIRVPLLPRSSLGGPRVYWGALGDPLERDGDFAKSLIWVYECVHLGRRRGPCGTSEGREVERILRPDA